MRLKSIKKTIECADENIINNKAEFFLRHDFHNEFEDIIWEICMFGIAEKVWRHIGKFKFINKNIWEL